MIGLMVVLRRRPSALVLAAMLAAAALPTAVPIAAAAPGTVASATAAAAPAAPRPAAGSKAPLVPISTPPPDFPEHARRARKSGYVVVSYTVGVDGRVGNVRILESEPRGIFDRAVETTLARWRYEPPSTPREITHTFYFDQ